MNNIYIYEYRAKRLTNNKWAYGYMLVNSAGKYCLNGACQFEDNSQSPVYIDKNTFSCLIFLVFGILYCRPKNIRKNG